MVGDEAEGFVLTGYFYDQLARFEHGDTGLKDAFPNWLHDIDVDKVKKQAGSNSVRLQRRARCHTGHKPRNPYPRSTKPNGHWPAETQPEPCNSRKRRSQPTKTPGRCYFVLGQRSFARWQHARRQRRFREGRSGRQGSAHRGLVAHLSWAYFRFAGRSRRCRRAVQGSTHRAAISPRMPRRPPKKGLQSPYEPPEAPQPPKS